MKRLILTLTMIVSLAAPSAADAAPWDFFYNINWGENRKGPWASFQAIASAKVDMTMTCDAWMSKGSVIFGMSPERRGKDFVSCTTYGKWVGRRGVYTAHFSFIGRIGNPKYVWEPSLVTDPSCRLKHPRLMVCENIERRSVRGPRAPTLAYRAIPDR
jgi:hypothetical protein